MKATLTLTTCILVLGACSNGRETTGPAAAAQPPGPAFTATATGQIGDIEALIAAQDAAWAAKDAAAYGATYTVDAVVINPVGGFLSGRTFIQTQHAFLFGPTGPFRNSVSNWSLRNLTFLTGSTALVELDVTLTGYSFLPPGLPEYQPGTVLTRVTWIAVRRDDLWQILRQQMTPVPGA